MAVTIIKPAPMLIDFSKSASDEPSENAQELESFPKAREPDTEESYQVTTPGWHPLVEITAKA